MLKWISNNRDKITLAMSNIFALITGMQLMYLVMNPSWKDTLLFVLGLDITIFYAVISYRLTVFKMWSQLQGEQDSEA